MKQQLTSIRISPKELIFQLILHSLVFLFFSFDRYNPQINEQQVVFFLNYTLAAFLINYFLLPHFFYRKKYFQFLIFFLLLVGGVIALEEIVLEQIYFPDTRGKHFPGVFFSLIQVLPVISILSGFKFAWDAIAKQQEVDELKAAMRESELQFLTSQINPHFLFNNLNNLYSYAIENSPKTPTIILELSSVLRYMLYECKAPFVPLTKEIEQLENFTQLSQLQIEERGEVHLHTHNLHPDYQIAPLILIVFIENAFKHSQASQSENIQITIDISLSEEGELAFFCTNTHQPVSNTESLSKGIGLENVKKRLSLLYPQSHSLDIQESETHYTVNLTLQLKKKEFIRWKERGERIF